MWFKEHWVDLLRILMVAAGLATLTLGLWQFEPWIAKAVLGGLLIILGLIG